MEEGGPSAEQTVEANFRQAVQSDVSRVLAFYRKKVWSPEFLFTACRVHFPILRKHRLCAARMGPKLHKDSLAHAWRTLAF